MCALGHTSARPHTVRDVGVAPLRALQWGEKQILINWRNSLKKIRCSSIRMRPKCHSWEQLAAQRQEGRGRGAVILTA